MARDKENQKRLAKEWYERNKELAIQRALKWQKDNIDKKREINLKWREENREQHNSTNRIWSLKNKPLKASLQAKRRAAKLQRTPAWLTAEDHRLMADYYQMAKELETLFPWKQHVDHIVPLQGKLVSGLHTPLNLQILSEASNLKKSNKTPA
jgi:5-methylcytosine-specific restriction endonuclease McrA